MTGGLRKQAHREAVGEIIRECMNLLEGVEHDLTRRGYQDANQRAREMIMREMVKQLEKAA